MQPETIDKISQWLTLITLGAALVGTFAIVGTAAIQSLRNRVVRWDMLAYVLVILWSLPWGIRNYGPELTDATIDLMLSLAAKRPEMESAIREFIGSDVTNDPVAPQLTPTPLPTVPDTFEETATAYFEDFPTALPAVTPEPADTPRPTVRPTWTLVPSPTVCVAQQAGDIARGCVPPTPVPGN